MQNSSAAKIALRPNLRICSTSEELLSRAEEGKLRSAVFIIPELNELLQEDACVWPIHLIFAALSHQLLEQIFDCQPHEVTFSKNTFYLVLMVVCGVWGLRIQDDGASVWTHTLAFIIPEGKSRLISVPLAMTDEGRMQPWPSIVADTAFMAIDLSEQKNEALLWFLPPLISKNRGQA